MKFPIVALVVTTGVAAAQPSPPPPPPDTVGGTVGGTVDVTPTPPPQPPPPPQPMMHHHDMEAADPVRPEELAVAIGIGYTFPDSLETPNTTSARLRLVSGLTFEPRVTISSSSQGMDTGAGTSTNDTTTVLSIGTLLRYPLVKHGRVDFELLGSAGFSTTKHDPPGDYNTQTNNSIELGWGIGVGAWLSHHWQLSLSAVNPVVTYTSQTTETGPTTHTHVSTTEIGVQFDPVVILMIHLYN